MKDADCVAFLQWALPQLGLRWPGFRTYFGAERAGLALERIASRLRPGGALVIGVHETLPAGPFIAWHGCRAVYRLEKW